MMNEVVAKQPTCANFKSVFSYDACASERKAEIAAEPRHALNLWQYGVLIDRGGTTAAVVTPSCDFCLGLLRL